MVVDFGRVMLTPVLLLYATVIVEAGVTHLEVPNFVPAGEEVELGCHHDVPEDRLYQLSWYQDDQQILRFLPYTTHKVRIPQSRLNVSTELSTGPRLVLSNVQLSASGVYKCSVMTQTPEYVTYARALPMTVVVDTPRIYGIKNQYHICDTAHLTCVTPLSRPSVQVTWYINGDQWEAPQEYITDAGTTETRKELKFTVLCKHFPSGVMTLRCSVSIFGLAHKSLQLTGDSQVTFTVPHTECPDIGSDSSSNIHGETRRDLLMVLLVVVVIGAFLVEMMVTANP